MKQVPAQVWQLMVAYALMGAGTSLMVLIAGISDGAYVRFTVPLEPCCDQFENK